MDHHDLPDMTDRVEAVRSGDATAESLVRASLERIAQHNHQLNCYVQVFADEALAAAQRIDERLAAGRPVGPLAGVPISVKDNIATTLGRTTCGSRMLEHYRSPFDATVVERLRDAGAIVVGKTNLDEFAMGSSNEHSAFGLTRNPRDPSRVPGGSSGGGAAAVAAGMSAAAIGSDTGGSVRQPAGFCGVVGLKPTYGRISRWGLVAFASSFDQVGPITTSVRDAALLLTLTAGVDERDATTADVGMPDLLAALDEPANGLRIGLPRQYRDERNDPAVNAVLEHAVEALRNHGAEIIDLDLPLTEHGLSAYYVVAPAEASSNLARYDGVRYGRRTEAQAGEALADFYARTRSEGFGAEVQRRIMLGTYVLSAGYYEAYYGRAMKVRRLIRDEYDRAFQSCDVILGPTSPTPPFRLGEKADPLAMYLADIYTANTNVAGICGISVPGGFAHIDGVALPVGLHLQAAAFDEVTLLRAARLLERALPDARRPPATLNMQHSADSEPRP